MAAISKTLTIPNGGANSEELLLADFHLVALMIMAPETLTEVVNIEVATKPSGTFRTLRSNGTAIALAADFADMITSLAGCILRLHSTSNVGADRVFNVIAHPKI